MAIRYIEMTRYPVDTVECFSGEEFPLDGFEFTLTYDNGETLDITNNITVVPNPLENDTTSVVFHYLDEEGMDRTIAFSDIKVHPFNKWRFLDKKGLAYFYTKLRQTFLSKDTADDYSGEEYYNKVIVYNDNGKISYSMTSTDDLSLIQDISTLVSGEHSDKADDFVNLIHNICINKGYVNTSDVMTEDDINIILES